MSSAASNSSTKVFLAWYLSNLATNPLRTKACTSGLLSGLQELTAQKLSGSKKLDKRIIQMACYGLFISGPLNHLMYEIMNKLFAGKSGPKVKVGQLLFSNLIISPVMNSVYLTAMAILAGVRSPAKLKANIKAGLLPMQKVSWVVSPLTLVFAQSFLPPTTWVPFFNLVAFVFGTYINTMIKRKRISEQDAKKQ
ncbi:hypothetical protein G6F57_000864 [Rhizopus arrhizus]|uniref:Integral membrane protein n=1 Tax=Rhizopus oryzae TaxID=64495 RepID=A0A9P6X7D5_RHIOR|nr:hypothetical protein G6F23_006449 [Rhizopus arrhizus]KAG1412443.1 hypothetical protein G6F58_008008 [Rhizopus delemar]KAG0762099.1 hypothetical protein G6F24_007052 [Rhizopus arrhizus]KAG0790561.1 hypothetical protein G6F21_005719 [Rhizopus arrhizus]KAG0799595.1 hypothetical protein G6F22_003068 [Rhizopus arrhizus]